MRLWGLSDVHSTNKFNFEYLKEMLSERSKEQYYSNDILLVAGDVTFDSETLRKTMQLFVDSFKSVFYVPGNHEYWISNENSFTSSFKKWESFSEILKLYRVYTEPKIIEDEETKKKVLILPIFSWYKDSFDYSLEISQSELMNLQKKWSDFHFCKWPKMDISKEFLRQNEKKIFQTLKNHIKNNSNNDEKFENDYLEYINKEFDTVISFSHFLPRRELLPKREKLRFPSLHRVAGDLNIDIQIRKFGSKIHLFGHSHIDVNLSIDGITYIQNSLGSTLNKRIKGKSLTSPFEPIILYDTKNKINHHTFWPDWD